VAPAWALRLGEGSVVGTTPPSQPQAHRPKCTTNTLLLPAPSPRAPLHKDVGCAVLSSPMQLALLSTRLPLPPLE
jgi:hypothetical protein